MKSKRLFVDIDGTLAVFKKVQTIERLYEKGYFLNLEPIENVVYAIRRIIIEFPDIEVFILSSVLSDSEFALGEKNEWLDKYLPEISKEHRLFLPCGQDKKDYIPGGINENDYLLDDYTANLIRWEPPAKGIKILNGINGTQGSWQSERISIEKSEAEIAYKIINIIYNQEHYCDVGSNCERESWALRDVYLTHDGYARFDINIYDCVLGYFSDFKVSGKIRFGNEKRSCDAQIESIDTYGINHPIIKREWRDIELCVMQGLEEAIAKEDINSSIIPEGVSEKTFSYTKKEDIMLCKRF